MTKNIYFVVARKYSNGKRFATVWQVSKSSNILSLFDTIKNAEFVLYCDTKKKADEIAADWNYTWKCSDKLADYDIMVKEG